MIARFELNGEMVTNSVLKVNDKTIIVNIKTHGKDRIIKRHKIKHRVILIPTLAEPENV